jgi:hypothetical protein
VFRQLPALKKRLHELEHLVAELEEKLAACRSLDVARDDKPETNR